MYTFNRLPGAARNYKQPGKKLRPRDAYVAYLTSRNGPGFHSTREAMRAQAVETAAYGPDPRGEYDPYRHVLRTLSRMSARTRKRIEHAFDEFSQRNFRPHLPRGQRRVFDAMCRAESIERCLQADANMLRNAR